MVPVPCWEAALPFISWDSKKVLPDSLEFSWGVLLHTSLVVELWTQVPERGELTLVASSVVGIQCREKST